MNTRLAQDGIRRGLGNNRHRHAETLLAQGTEPDLMAPPGLPHKMASMRDKNSPQAVIETPAHLGTFKAVKGKRLGTRHGLRRNRKIFRQKLRGNLANTGQQRIASAGLGDKTQIIANSRPHAGDKVMRDLDDKMHRQTRSKTLLAADKPMGQQKALLLQMHANILSPGSPGKKRGAPPGQTARKARHDTPSQPRERETP
nr:hypothetical protein [Verminephrobacter aporrectodeae]